MTKKPINPHRGETLDDFLREEGIYEEVNREALKHAIKYRKALTPEQGAELERFQKDWLAENQEAIETYNRKFEDRGGTLITPYWATNPDTTSKK